MDHSPFNQSGITRRSPPTTPRCQTIEDETCTVKTTDIFDWMSKIDNFLSEISNISTEGKLNSDQKLKISNLCRKVNNGVGHMAVHYQSLMNKFETVHSALHLAQEKEGLAVHLTEIKQSIKDSRPNPSTPSISFADMVKKGSNTFIRPNNLSTVAIYPTDNLKTSEETKKLVQQIISPEDIKLKVRGVRKVRNGGLIISTETKEDVEKLKQSVQLTSSGLKIDEPRKRKPRIIIIGVPASMSEQDVRKCIYEQNLSDKMPGLSRDSFMETVTLSHKSGRRDAENCNMILEVPAAIRKALISQERIFINWTSCPVRDFTTVTRCYKCQQYGHAAKTCKIAITTCGHCGMEGHSVQECTKQSEPPKCATCMRVKKQHDHKTGDPECPARKAAEYRYINSIDYEGA